MRNFLTATALVWPWLAGALALPLLSGSESSDTSRHIASVFGATSGKEVSVRFETPCQGCFIGTEDGLVFALTVAQAEGECGDISPPLVNGVFLDGLRNRNHSRGRGVLQTELVNRLGGREIYASWETLCIPHQAQLLSFTVHSIGQDKVRVASGFTASFQQQGQPEILRLAGEPTDLGAKDISQWNSWVAPSPSQRLSIVTREPDRGQDQVLHNQFHQLAVLQTQAHELQAAIHEKRKHIRHIIQRDFRSTIDACPGIKCVLQTTFQTVPKIIRFITDHFRHGPPLSYNIYQSAANESRSLEKDLADKKAELLDVPQPSSYQDADKPDWPLPPQEDLPSPRPPVEAPHPPAPHPPPPYPPPPMELPAPGSNPPARPGEEPQPSSHDGQGQHRPLPPHRHHHRHGPRILKRIILFAIFASAATFFFRRLHRNTALFRRCCNYAADGACRREERQNRRGHRHAALHHHWSSWWSRYRQPKNSADYNEKRNLILGQEGMLEDAMQDELRALRSAHALIEEMYDAEEGRSRLYRAANRPGASAAELDAAGVVRSSSRRRRRDSVTGSVLDDSPLPPPPQYEEELEGDLTVVDGFQYTPRSSNGTDDSSSSIVNDYTPDSSVVDCSPRMSSDTARTVVTRGDGEE